MFDSFNVVRLNKHTQNKAIAIMIAASHFTTQKPIASWIMTARRFLLLLLVVLSTMVLLTWQFVRIVSVDGFAVLDLILTGLFVICLLWTVVGFWNGVIGFCVMRFSRSTTQDFKPHEPITCSTAVLMCIRNEDVDAVFHNMRQMAQALASTQAAKHFHFYILSDTNNNKIALAECQAFEALRAEFADILDITYRLRSDNNGFKAGNIRDFCDNYGVNHDFMIVLDADSVMSGQAMLHLTQIMQAQPNLGILQHLTVGLPSKSAFTRIFQFGMRLGMRSYTLGSAWWQGDCGPYWGHNAIIRIAPFTSHCVLPKVAGTGALSGDILSHDQIEAVLMRKAGYECRVLPIEEGSYEQNPPSLLEFMRRDLRWCQGNMQYLKLLGMKGIKPTSRYQMLSAIGMFIGSPVAVLFGVIATARLLFTNWHFDGAAAQHLVLVYLLMSFAPKLATLADVLMHKDLRASFGGAGRVLMGSAIETLFSILLVPIMCITEVLFLARLACGQSIGWGTQYRGAQQTSFSEAAQKLWLHTLFGCIAAVVFVAIGWMAFWWTLPMTLGLVLSVPFAALTSHPVLGRILHKAGLCTIPEETLKLNKAKLSALKLNNLGADLS